MGHRKDFGAKAPTTEVDWPHEPVMVYPWAHVGCSIVCAGYFLVLYVRFGRDLAMLCLVAVVVAASAWVSSLWICLSDL
jgi:hypothetical protein